MAVEGRGFDLSFKRTYRSGSSRQSALGKRWDFNWNQFVILEFNLDVVRPWGGPGKSAGSDSPITQDSDLEPALRAVRGVWYYDGQTNIHGFVTDPNSSDLVPPKGVFSKIIGLGSTGVWNVHPPEAFAMRTVQGMIYTFGIKDEYGFGRNSITYRLTKVEDRQGNSVSLEYETAGTTPSNETKRVKRVVDTLGRSLTFEYAEGSLASVADSEGRVVRFGYEDEQLTAVTSPVVVGTSTGNDFPQGKTEKYGYASDLGLPILEGRLTTITSPEAVASGGGPYLENFYGGGSQVWKQRLGGVNASGVPAGGDHIFLSKSQSADSFLDWGWFLETRRVLTVDPSGNTILRLFDKNGNNRLTYRFTGRLHSGSLSMGSDISSLVSVNPASPNGATDGLIGGTPKLRAGDPASWVERRAFDEQGSVIELQTDSLRIEYVYSGSPDVFQKPLLITETRYPVPATAGVEPIRKAYLYEPFFGQLRAVYDPRGLDPTFAPPGGGANSPERYSVHRIYDYQEGAYSGGPMEQLANDWDIDLEQTEMFQALANVGVSASPIQDSFGLSDQNDDGISNQSFGNSIRDTVNVRALTNAASSTPGFTTLESTTTRVYNGFSLLVKQTNPGAQTTYYEYYSEEDPDGDGVATTPPTSWNGTLSTAQGAAGGDSYRG